MRKQRRIMRAKQRIRGYGHLGYLKMMRMMKTRRARDRRKNMREVTSSPSCSFWEWLQWCVALDYGVWRWDDLFRDVYGNWGCLDIGTYIY